MKQVTNQVFKPLNTTEVKTLCSETKETTLTQNQLKKFSVVDLWSIQKNRKTVSFRRSMAI
jgi:hypothetical protein